MKNYLMKYMDKQFSEGTESWTKGDLLFNAMMWETKTRMWGASKELTAIMRRPEEPESGVVWETVELVTPAGEYNVWCHEDATQALILNDPDNLCPEGYVTKVQWANMYEGIRHRMEDSQIAISYPIDSREARRLRNRATGW